MSYLRLKCIKFRSQLGLPQDPAGGAHSAPLDLKGPTSKGREGSGRERGIKGKGERGLEPPPLQISGYATAINPVIHCDPIASLSCTFPGQNPTLDVAISPLLLPNLEPYTYAIKSHHHLTPSNVTSKHTISPCPTSDLMFLALVHNQIF